MQIGNIDTAYIDSYEEDFRLAKLLGMEETVEREIAYLRERHPEIESASDYEKARFIFEWLIPSPDSIREARSNGSWVRQNVHYKEEQYLPDGNILKPAMNCFGLAIIATLMARRVGIETSIAAVYSDVMGNQDDHASSYMDINGGIFVDTSYYKFIEDKSFNARHRKFVVLSDKEVYYTFLAYQFREQGYFEEEELCYQKVLETNPNEIDSWYNLGLMMYRRDKLEEALACFERALKIFPESASNLVAAADISLQLGDEQKAMDYYRRAVSVDVKLLRAQFKDGDWKVYTMENPDRIKAMEELGVLLLEHQKPDEALGFLLEALKHQSKEDPDLLFYIGTGYAMKQDSSNALKHLARAYKLASDGELESWKSWVESVLNSINLKCEYYL